MLDHPCMRLTHAAWICIAALGGLVVACDNDDDPPPTARPGPCAGTGLSCAGPADCCSGVCQNAVCMPCAGIGAPCSDTPCCAAVPCNPETKLCGEACVGDGAECTTAD